MIKVAIIEDDPAIAEMYHTKFESEGYQVETARNGTKGLAMVNKLRPDIILLDIIMPDMPGDEMLRELRKTDWGYSTKVVILTNKSEQEVTQAVRDLGVSAVIVKANMTPRQVAALVKQQLFS